MKRVWILGASGHVGSAMIKHLNCLEYEIFPTDEDEVDVTNEADVIDYALLNRPDVIMNCSGYTDVTACEENPELAYKINAIGARNVAIAAQKIGAKLVQMSTDDVFDGQNRHPYTEFDAINPRSIYGKSKLAGEEFVKTMVNRYLIVRSSWIYGVGYDFTDYVLSHVGKVDKLEIPNNQYATPTSSKTLARVIADLINHDEYGIYHIVSKGSCSRYEYAREILRQTGNLNKLELCPVIKENLTRPSYSVLDNMMLRITGIKEPGDWKEEFAEFVKETGGAV